ncbi:MAG: hypothetical protein PVJ98_00260 [Akkermansiaceae bacterium]|jgi:hypothetical protein
MKSYLFLFLIFLPVLRAAVIGDPAEATVSLNYFYFAGHGDYSVSGGDSLDTTESGELVIDEDLYGETLRTTFNGSLAGRLAGDAVMTTLEDPIDGTQYFASLRVILESDATLSGNGTFLDGEPGGSGIFNSQLPGNELIFPFEVTETAAGVLRGLITVDDDNASIVQAQVQRLVDGAWQTQLTFIRRGVSTALQDSMIFQPGSWRIVASSPGNATIQTDDNAGKILDQRLQLTLTFGSERARLPLPDEGDFTNPLIFNEYTDSPKLSLINRAILSEQSTGDGSTEVEFTADLVNTSLCPWDVVSWSVRTDQPGTESAEMLVPFGPFNDVPADATVSPSRSQKVRVLDAELPALRAGILDGSLLTTTGKELLVFRYPVDRLADEDDLPTAEELVDREATEFQVPGTSNPFFFIEGPTPTFPNGKSYVEEGIMWVEWEPYYAVPPVFVTPVGTNLTTLQQNFDRLLPMWVTSASIDDGTIPEPRWTSTIMGDTLTFLDIVKHGSVRHVIKSPYPAPGSNATEGQLIETQGLFPSPIPLHLDRIPFGASANLSGNVNFIPENFAVSYEMENGSPKSFLVDLSYTAEVNFLLEAGLENVGPVADSEKTLFEAPIFSVALPGGITFTPQLEITSGVTADFTRRVSIPFVSRFTIDVTVGMKDGLPYYEDRTTTVPLQLSDPQVFEEIGASASVFLETEIDAIFGYPGSFTSAGPTVGARLAADFSMNPLADPWWSTSGNLEVTAGVEFDFIDLITLVDEERVFEELYHFRSRCGRPLDSRVARRTLHPSSGRRESRTKANLGPEGALVAKHSR